VSVLAATSVALGWPNGGRPAWGGRYAAAVAGLALAVVLRPML
jgi:hypothetical protein